MSHLNCQRLNEHFNRTLIAGLTLISILLDGWFADAMTMAAVLLWLWLPEWQTWFKNHSIKTSSLKL
ncbi:MULTISPECIES: hypothetical protein [unclassified Motilimonas]|uniref:hypothetical protein n=1 Tax=Motilimonas TaxID=1914248 RepID=UPI001E5E9F1D|nr:MULTISPECIES: hypothetical protein [unclassified Motilimonas]MCE0557118.1 hypothetical protein [Motilimonas sp. E26]MDO6524353.1 hypothetical protein [Motilimonas sp. 1_MG-2023]